MIKKFYFYTIFTSISICHNSVRSKSFMHAKVDQRETINLVDATRNGIRKIRGKKIWHLKN